jgi:homogentisate 1,2-dioxygenase
MFGIVQHRKFCKKIENMQRIAVSEYPAQRHVCSAWKNKIHFNGAHQLNDGVFAQKIAFDTEYYTNEPPPSITATCRGSRQSLIMLKESVRPKAYRIEHHSSTPTPVELLRTANGHVCVKIMKICGDDESTGIFMNADCDEVWYVHKGGGMCHTLLGTIGFNKGDYIFIPRLVAYRFLHWTPDKTGDVDMVLIAIESREQLKRPVFPQRDIPYNVSEIILPEPRGERGFVSDFLKKGLGNTVNLKRAGEWIEVQYENTKTLFSCVAYDGVLYPFVLPTNKIRPMITTDCHTDPNMFATFITESNDVAISTFAPRWVHSLPYFHLNHWDECLFLAKTYGARGGSISTGDMTFHPQGFFHGPQPSALDEWRKGAPKNSEESPWHDDLAIMFESREPLFHTKDSVSYEISDYWKSWKT